MPLHPAIVHLPLALAVLLPVLIVVFTWAIKSKRMDRAMWAIIIGLQLLLTASGYLALETGETDEDKVATVVEKSLIHSHEEAAEIFVGVSVIAFAISLAAFFLKEEFQFKTRIATFALSIITAFFGLRAGNLGGEIVYRHGGAVAHSAVKEILRAEPVSPEAPEVVEPVNESLKLDDHEYSDEVIIEEENLKSED